MTVRELKCEVFALAHLPLAEADELFFSSVSRALVQIHSELSITETRRLHITPCRPSVRLPRIIHYSGESKTLPISGRAYSLTVCGKGYFTVKDGYDVLRYDFDTDGKCFKGFIKNGGEICFSGEYTYSVLDFVTFSSILSDRLDDIPDGSSVRQIDLSSPDLLCPVTQPKEASGKSIDGAFIMGKVLTLPSDFEGSLCFDYIKNPAKCSDEEEMVDIPSRYSVLLAPLVASFILIDDDAALANKYEGIYQTLKKELLAHYLPRTAERVITNGWA